MKRIVITTALALAAAAPAFANDQLARSLGLEPGVYSSAELAAIKGVVEERDSANANVVATLIGRSVSGVVSTQSVGSSAGQAQLASNLGVDAATYTPAELAAVKGAIEERDTSNAGIIATLKDRAAGGIVSTQSVGTSAGQAQLAANLGLDPAAYTPAELAAIKGAIEQADTSDAAYIDALLAR